MTQCGEWCKIAAGATSPGYGYMKLLKTLFNVGSHVAIGYFVGNRINSPKYRHGAYLVAGTFVIYQVLGAWRKGDYGYPEVKEFGIGAGLALAQARLDRRYRIWDRVRRWIGGRYPAGQGQLE